MRNARIVPFLLIAALLAGCDFVSVAPDPVARAERPEGWKSLEDEGSTLRLYYQFVDAQQRVRFVETLDDVPEALRAGVGFVKMAVPPPVSPGDAARARAGASPGGSRLAKAPAGGAGIVLYSADWCPACQKAKRYLARQGVDYEERDVDDPRWADELLRKTGARAIPVIDAGGRILTGFSASGYDRLIAAR